MWTWNISDNDFFLVARMVEVEFLQKNGQFASLRSFHAKSVLKNHIKYWLLRKHTPENWKVHVFFLQTPPSSVFERIELYHLERIDGDRHSHLYWFIVTPYPKPPFWGLRNSTTMMASVGRWESINPTNKTCWPINITLRRI